MPAHKNQYSHDRNGSYGLVDCLVQVKLHSSYDICEEGNLLKLAGYVALCTFIILLTGTATPEPPTEAPPVVTTPHPSDPLEVNFANNTSSTCCGEHCYCASD